MFKFIGSLFKKKPVDKDHEERLHDLETLTHIQAQIITNLVNRLEEVKKFRDFYVEDIRVICNAVANIDKRTAQIEELIQHMNYQISEIEENISTGSEEDEEEEDSIFTSREDKSNLN